MTSDSHRADDFHSRQLQWYWIAVISGLLSLFCYFATLPHPPGKLTEGEPS